MKNDFKLYGILVLFLLHGLNVKAQQKRLREPAKVLLVMLFSEENRMEALIKAGRYSDTAQLRKDMVAVRNATIRDFTDHFNYCPVYFYMDGNFDAVMNKQFQGVLLDNNLQTANVSISDTNFLIVYYGFPGWQSHKGRMEVTTQTDVGGKPNGWGLIVNNHEMRQVAYTYWLQGINLKKRGKMYGYKYVSAKFDIEYYPLALELDTKLKRYAANYARKQAEMKQKEEKKKSKNK